MRRSADPRPHRLPRLSDVAALAGVSVATASLALNGQPVAETTRERVQEAAAQLRYVARSHAKALKTGQTGVIGFWIVNRPGTVELTEDSGFFYRILRGAFTAAETHGFSISFNVARADLAQVGEHLSAVAGRGLYDAVIIAAQWANDGSYAGAVRARGVPVVTLNDPHEPGDANVRVDQEAGIRLAVDHLVANGHTDIAYLAGPAGHLDADARLAAFYKATAERGLRVPERHVRRVDFTIEAGAAAFAALLDGSRSFTALLAADDFVAAGAIQTAHERGLRVPADVSVVGFDDVDVARATTPPLTTVKMPMTEVGERAATAAAALVRQDATVASVVLAPSLVERASVTAPGG